MNGLVMVIDASMVNRYGLMFLKQNPKTTLTSKTINITHDGEVI